MTHGLLYHESPTPTQSSASYIPYHPQDPVQRGQKGMVTEISNEGLENPHTHTQPPSTESVSSLIILDLASNYIIVTTG